MMHKYTVLLLLSVLSLMGQAQSLSFQELLNKKKFTEVIALADSLTPADSRLSAKLTKVYWNIMRLTGVISIVCKWIRRMSMP